MSPRLPVGFTTIFLPVPDKIIAMFLHRTHPNTLQTNDIVTYDPVFHGYRGELPLHGFFLGAGSAYLCQSKTPSVECTAKCSDTEIGVTAFRFDSQSRECASRFAET